MPRYHILLVFALLILGGCGAPTESKSDSQPNTGSPATAPVKASSTKPVADSSTSTTRAKPKDDSLQSLWDSLPVYPGSTSKVVGVKDSSRWRQEYTTHDSLDKVISYYKSQLGSDYELMNLPDQKANGLTSVWSKTIGSKSISVGVGADVEMVGSDRNNLKKTGDTYITFTIRIN